MKSFRTRDGYKVTRKRLPDSEGVWRLKLGKGEFLDLRVFNVGKPLKEDYFRFYYRGGYYDLEDWGGEWVRKMPN